MNQLFQIVTGFFSDEILKSKVITFAYVFLFGWFQVSKADVAWWLSAVVGLLAAANYIDQIIQRRKTKK